MSSANIMEGEMGVKTSGNVLFTWLKARGSALVIFALFVGGIVALYHTLQSVDLVQIKAKVHAISWHQIGLAALFTTVGYLALVGYDWSALRYIRKKLPLPLVAFTSFVGFALSNTIGVSWLSGGAVRYRIYSRVGLSAKEVALVTAFCTLGFGIGEVIVGGAALINQPALLANYLNWSTGSVALIGWLLIGSFLALLVFRSLRGDTLSWRGREFRLPTTSILASQIGFSVLDIVCAGATFYVLLPDSTLGFFAFLAIFSVALVIGILSHVPGGVGVFEAVMLNVLAPFMPLEQIAAALVIYRVTYYLAPFLLGVVMLIFGETFVLLKQRNNQLSQSVNETLSLTSGVLSFAAPLALSATTFIAGALLLLGSSMPVSPDTIQLLTEFFPTQLVEMSHWFGGSCGALLIMISYGLWQRIRAALWLAAGLLSAGVVTSLLQTLDFDRALVMVLGLIMIVVSRDRFYRRSRLFSDLTDIRWFVLTLAAVISFTALLFFSFKQTPYQHELWWQFAIDDQAPRSMRTMVIAATVLLLGYLWMAIRAPKLEPQSPTDAELLSAQQVINNQNNPDAYFALTGDKALLFSEFSDAFVMFGVRGKSWVSMGDPVAADEAGLVDLIWQFKDVATRNQGHAIFYQIPKSSIHYYIDANFSLLKLGEEALVPLDTFALKGPERAKLRQSHNKALRQGLSFELAYPPHSAELLAQCQEISDEWLLDKGVREKGFSLGFFDITYINRTPLAIVRQNGSVSAFANVLMTPTLDTATIDMMRHRNDADSTTMDFLFIELMLNLQTKGYARFSLGMAPLSGLTDREAAPMWDRFGMLIYKRGKRFYNFEGLRRFKDKFDPVWEPKYLATDRAGITPYLVLADIGALTSGGLAGMFHR